MSIVPTYTVPQLLQCPFSRLLRRCTMSIWENIKTAIFGHAHSSAPMTTNVGAGTRTANPTAASVPPAAAATPATPATGPVDIETVMKGYEAKTPQQLNWRTSIVD